MFQLSAFECFLFLFVASLDYGECGANITTHPPSNTSTNDHGKISIYDAKVDICYHEYFGKWPRWLSPGQKNYRAQLKIKLFKHSNGSAYNKEEIKEICKNYKYTTLYPDKNAMHYEFCWYAKYGIWRQTPLTRVEEAIRCRMIDEYLYENDQRIPYWKVIRLCPNFFRMECKECSHALQQNCYYARYGRWKNKAPSISQQRRFFYTGAKRIGIKELIKKCPKYFNKQCRVIHYPNCK